MREVCDCLTHKHCLAGRSSSHPVSITIPLRRVLALLCSCKGGKRVPRTPLRGGSTPSGGQVGPTPSGDPQEVSRREGGGSGVASAERLGDESVWGQCLAAVSDFVLAPSTQCCKAALPHQTCLCQCPVLHSCCNSTSATVCSAAPQGCLSLTWLLHKPESCHNGVSVFLYEGACHMPQSSTNP